MFIATSYPGLSYSGLLSVWVTLCALFCIPAGIGFLAVWRFGTKLWGATLALGLMSAVPSALALATIQLDALGARVEALPPLLPLFLGLLLCIISIRRGQSPRA